MGGLKCSAWVQPQKQRNDLVLFPSKPFSITVIQSKCKGPEVGASLVCYQDKEEAGVTAEEGVKKEEGQGDSPKLEFQPTFVCRLS